MQIAERAIGSKQPVYVIAELSANHNGSLERALETVRAAAEAGADAIKLQTYTADTLTLNCDNEYFRIQGGTLWDGKTLYELYQDAAMPWEWHDPIFNEAVKAGLTCFSTPFDASAVEFLEGFDVPAHKIASFELVDIPLLKKIAATGKPVIASTGMASLAEIDEAVETLRQHGCNDLALLKCTSSYPADPAQMNLKTIPHLAEAFQVPVGLSDHTPGIAVPVAAVALGASVIEKHLTLDRGDGGPDSAFSLEPVEFKAMVEAVRTAEAALGNVSYQLSEKEEASRIFRRSLFVAVDMKAGEIFTDANVRSVRPGHGLPPRVLSQVLGRVAAHDLTAGTPLSWEIIQ